MCGTSGRYSSVVDIEFFTRLHVASVRRQGMISPTTSPALASPDRVRISGFMLASLIRGQLKFRRSRPKRPFGLPIFSRDDAQKVSKKDGA
jgi:hypothetical protein